PRELVRRRQLGAPDRLQHRPRRADHVLAAGEAEPLADVGKGLQVERGTVPLAGAAKLIALRVGDPGAGDVPGKTAADGGARLAVPLRVLDYQRAAVSGDEQAKRVEQWRLLARDH